MDFKRFLSIKKPCANCPFLKENGIEIGEERLAEIKQSLLDDDMTPFQCHKTTHPTGGYHDSEGVYHPSGREKHCAGALGFLYAKGRMNVPMRIGLISGLLTIGQLEEIELLIDVSP